MTRTLRTGSVSRKESCITDIHCFSTKKEKLLFFKKANLFAKHIQKEKAIYASFQHPRRDARCSCSPAAAGREEIENSCHDYYHDSSGRHGDYSEDDRERRGNGEYRHRTCEGNTSAVHHSRGERQHLLFPASIHIVVLRLYLSCRR